MTLGGITEGGAVPALSLEHMDSDPGATLPNVWPPEVAML